MLRYVRIGLLVIVVLAGILLPVTNDSLYAWVAGGGFVLVLVLSHPTVTSRLEPK